MFFIIGFLIVVGSVLGGYLPHGDIGVLIQPLEVLIILGAAIGALLASSIKPMVGKIAKSFGHIVKGLPYTKASYLELLTLLYSNFRLAKSKGMLALEAHIENPHESAIFHAYPNFMKNHHAVDFICDYLRLMTMGTENPHEFGALIDLDIETHHHEAMAPSEAIQKMADGLPAFGIVAAVLGVVVTMASITEPPEVLGGLIGAALVGTFLGVLLAYGIVGPMATALKNYADGESKYFACIKAGLMAHLQGYAPAVLVEFARKTLYSFERPTFQELEQAVTNAQAV